MRATGSMRSVCAGVAFGLLCAGAFARTPFARKPAADPVRDSLADYIARARAGQTTGTAAIGSLWTDGAPLARFTSDDKAWRPHDLVLIEVVEQTTATTDGTVTGQRSLTAQSQITGFGGKLSKANNLQNLLGLNGSSALSGKGQSVSNSHISTALGAEVEEVLPNGTLVVQAERRVEFNQQQQTVMLRGLVRPEDIGPNDAVLSTSVSNLELEVKGKGVINDFTRRPNPVVRAVLQVLGF